MANPETTPIPDLGDASQLPTWLRIRVLYLMAKVMVWLATLLSISIAAATLSRHSYLWRKLSMVIDRYFANDVFLILLGRRDDG